MDKPKKQRTQLYKQQIRELTLKILARDRIENDNFDKLLKAGIIVKDKNFISKGV